MLFTCNSLTFAEITAFLPAGVILTFVVDSEYPIPADTTSIEENFPVKFPSISLDITGLTFAPTPDPELSSIVTVGVEKYPEPEKPIETESKPPVFGFITIATISGFLDPVWEPFWMDIFGFCSKFNTFDPYPDPFSYK